MSLGFLTIQERIELYKNDMAFSPSNAAKKVTSVAEAEISDFMCNYKFVNKGKSKLDDRSVTYSEHCADLSAAISGKMSKTNKNPYESRFGNACSDYIYITALSLASIPGRFSTYYDYNPSIYYNLRMTLGNYLDALIDMSYDSEKDKPNTRRANQYRKLKKELSKVIDPSTPLFEAIVILLNQYSNSHAELDRLSHIQKCKSDLDRFIQMDEMREEYLDYEDDSQSDEPYDTEPEYYEEDFAPVAFVTDDTIDDDEDTELSDKEMLIAAGDPEAYYLSKARKLPDISTQSPESLYAMGNDNPNLLADYDYSPEGFKARAAELPPEFREIADEVITAENLAKAFKGMDAVTDKLFRLLIEPFAEIGKYRFERHIASDAETA